MFYQDLLSPLGMRTEDDDWSQQVVYYRAGNETRGLDLEKRRKCKDLKLVYLLSWPTCFSGRLDWQIPRECMLSFGTMMTR